MGGMAQYGETRAVSESEKPLFAAAAQSAIKAIAPISRPATFFSLSQQPCCNLIGPSQIRPHILLYDCALPPVLAPLGASSLVQFCRCWRRTWRHRWTGFTGGRARGCGCRTPRRRSRRCWLPGSRRPRLPSRRQVRSCSVGRAFHHFSGGRQQRLRPVTAPQYHTSDKLAARDSSADHAY